jgi:hypothetical protein
MDSKYHAKMLPITVFTYQDRSSKEAIEVNNRLSITTANWNEVKEQFIEERYSYRRFEAWSKAEWASKELKYLEQMDFSLSEDREILKERYSKELLKIAQKRIKSPENQIVFKWDSQKANLNLLHQELTKGRYIEATKEEFGQLFSGQEASIIQPIKWKATQWELGFFIEYLLQKEIIAKGNHIKISCLLFISEHEQPFKEASLKSQMSEARKSIGIAGNAAKQEKLKELINLCVLG